MKKIFATITISVASFMYGQNALVLDKSFANNGVFIQDESSKAWDASKVIQNLDKTLLHFKQRTNSTTGKEENILIKLKENGSIDTSFGTNGEVIINIESADHGLGVRLQNDGKIILIGGIIDTQIIRLHPNGQIDTSFGNNGKTIVSNYGTNDTIGSQNFHILKNGEILFFSTSSGNNFFFKILSNGSIDNSFGDNGKLEVNSDHFNIDSNENIVCLKDIQGNEYTIERYSKNGKIDTTFGNNGKLNVTTSLYYDSISYNWINTQDDILFSTDAGTKDIFKIKSNGTLDESFQYKFSDFNIFLLNAVQKDQYFYVAGTKLDEASQGPSQLFITRIDEQGNQDEQFGYFLEQDTRYKFIENIIVNDDNIIVSGTYNDNNSKKKFVAKYLFNKNLSSAEVKPEFSEIVFTNPMKGTLYFQSKNSVDKIDLYNSEGRLVKTIKNNNTNISELTKGLYLAKVSFINGTTTTKKLIIE